MFTLKKWNVKLDDNKYIDINYNIIFSKVSCIKLVLYCMRNQQQSKNHIIDILIIYYYNQN